MYKLNDGFNLSLRLDKRYEFIQSRLGLNRFYNVTEQALYDSPTCLSITVAPD